MRKKSTGEVTCIRADIEKKGIDIQYNLGMQIYRKWVIKELLSAFIPLLECLLHYYGLVF